MSPVTADAVKLFTAVFPDKVHCGKIELYRLICRYNGKAGLFVIDCNARLHASLKQVEYDPALFLAAEDICFKYKACKVTVKYEVIDICLSLAVCTFKHLVGVIYCT